MGCVDCRICLSALQSQFWIFFVNLRLLFYAILAFDFNDLVNCQISNVWLVNNDKMKLTVEQLDLANDWAHDHQPLGNSNENLHSKKNPDWARTSSAY